MYEMPQMVQCDDDLWGIMQRSSDEQANLFHAYLGGVYIEHDVDVLREWVTLLLSGVASSVLELKSRDATLAGAVHPTNNTLRSSRAPPPTLSSPIPPPYAPLPPLPHPHVPNPVSRAPVVVNAHTVAMPPPPVLADFHIVVSKKRQELLWNYRYGA